MVQPRVWPDWKGFAEELSFDWVQWGISMWNWGEGKVTWRVQEPGVTGHRGWREAACTSGAVTGR